MATAAAKERPSPWASSEAIRTYVSGVLWALGNGLVLWRNEPDVAGWIRFRLDLPGVILFASAMIGGWNFFPKALRGIRRFRLDMNFLMTIAILGALLIGEPVEAAAIAFLFSFAELLEHAAVTRARRSVEELIRLAPERATIVDESGGERTVAASELRAGNTVRVRPGEKIPIDGVVTNGESAVDEAPVTGESVPAHKEPGSRVYAGTLAVAGFLEVRASTDAGDTTIDQIVRLVRQAQQRRAPIEQFVERFARYYTPSVTALAVLTMLGPPLLGLGASLEWFERGLTLLVVACPCALVIATPVTIVSAITSSARHGVLIKGGEFLEALGGTCAIAFDKTGTLTEGRLEVTDVEALDGRNSEDVLQLAALVEARSEHPVARAIVAKASARSDVSAGTGGIVTEFVATAGRGVTARVNGREVRIGTEALFPENAPLARAGELEREGKTTVMVGEQRRIIGIIALADRIRPEASEAVAKLQRLGFHDQIMITGDNESVANRVARSLGITEVRAGLLPTEKVAAIQQLKTRHRGVVMLGDGVNDAPALATSTVGIAMGAAGSPAAIETADIALMADDLLMLPYAVRVAQRARRVVRFNIVLALGLKVVLATGAVAGVVTLLIAVLLGDMGASLTITLNAMRIARLRP